MDIGCGSGFLSAVIAYADARRQVIGIDWSKAKIDLAQRILSNSSNNRLSFIHGDILAKIGKEPLIQDFDAVLCCDVLHYSPQNQQKKMVQAIWTVMKPGSTLVIRQDIESSESKSNERLKFEIWGRVLGFNAFKKGGPYYPLFSFLYECLTQAGFTNIRSPLRPMQLKNQIILLADKLCDSPEC